MHLLDRQSLADTFAPGSLGVADLYVAPAHPAFHLIEEHGCQLLFLPAYSPDCSPIEETFSKVKAFLRRTGARTREAPQERSFKLYSP